MAGFINFEDRDYKEGSRTDNNGKEFEYMMDIDSQIFYYKEPITITREEIDEGRSLKEFIDKNGDILFYSGDLDIFEFHRPFSHIPPEHGIFDEGRKIKALEKIGKLVDCWKEGLINYSCGC